MKLPATLVWGYPTVTALAGQLEEARACRRGRPSDRRGRGPRASMSDARPRSLPPGSGDVGGESMSAIAVDRGLGAPPASGPARSKTCGRGGRPDARARADRDCRHGLPLPRRRRRSRRVLADAGGGPRRRSEIPPIAGRRRFYDRDPTVPGAITTRWGGFLDGIDRFDAAFFGISPREAAHGPAAAAAAGGRVGGARGRRPCRATGSPGIRHRRLRRAPARATIVRSNTRIRVHRPSQRDGDGAQTSRTALLRPRPARAERRGRHRLLLVAAWRCTSPARACGPASATLALAGGVNLILRPQRRDLCSRMHMLSPGRPLQGLRRRADGFVRGEGCGAVVLKRLTDALADGDRVRAVIRAGREPGRPHEPASPPPAAGAAGGHRARMRDAGVDGRDGRLRRGARHRHGARRPDRGGGARGTCWQWRGRRRSVLLGSVKTNIGHLEGAAGIAGLVKAALVLQHRAIPPYVHFDSLNPHIELDGTRLTVPVAGRANGERAQIRAARASARSAGRGPTYTWCSRRRRRDAGAAPRRRRGAVRAAAVGAQRGGACFNGPATVTPRASPQTPSPT